MNDHPSTEFKLQQCLGPEFISTRSGHGGTKLQYIEGKTAINLANDIFGYNGWSSEIRDSKVDFIDTADDGRFSIGITTTVRITLKDGTFHEDIGYGVCENSRSKAAAYEKARKESTTDGMKRALRMFGNALGNCVYDKSYLRNVSNMGKPMIPFVPLELFRHSHIRKEIEQQMKPSTEKQLPDITAPSSNNHAKINTSKAPINQPLPTPAKRQIDEDFGPEILGDDSFILDDEDDEFYAQVAECHRIPSPSPSHPNNDHSNKRQKS